MNSNCTPPDGTTVRLVSRTERGPRLGKATAKILPFPLCAPCRDWQQGTLGSVVHADLAETLVDVLRQDQVNGNPAALAVVRLAEFPAFAEGFGHHTSQQLSRLFQRRLRGGLRDDELLEPLGEDEFALLLRGDIAAILERLMDRATGIYRLEGLRFHLSAGAGVALFPTDAINPDDLLRYARVALRQANPFGQPAFEFFSPEIPEQAQHCVSVATEVHQALGCRLGQGFGFSRPVAADAFGDLLARDPSAF